MRVNCINKQHFKMETVKSVRQSIMDNDWAVSIDLTDAYLHVPIQPISRKYLQFVYDHRVFQFTALPFGMSLSVGFHKTNECNSNTLTSLCSIFLPVPRQLANKRSDSQSTYLSHQIHSSNGTKSALHTKSEEVRFDSSTTIHIYRYGISNSTENSQSSSKTSRRSYSDHQNNSFSDSCFSMNFPFSFRETRCSSRLNSSGQIAFTTPANVPVIGIETSRSSFRSSSSDHQYDQIPFKMMDEFQSLRSRNAHSPDAEISLYTDASHYGWGAHLEPMSLSFHGRWLEDQFQLHSNMLEIMAIHFALIRTLKYIRHSCVTISINNTTVVSYINKQGGTHSSNICVEVWKILQWCLKHHIVVRICHIPGKFNVLADRVSRIDKIVKTEWALDQSIVNSIFQMFNYPNLDLFATRFSHKLPLYVSPVLDNQAFAIDAFSMNWNNLHAYAFLPTMLISSVLNKICQYQC